MHFACQKFLLALLIYLALHSILMSTNLPFGIMASAIAAILIIYGVVIFASAQEANALPSGSWYMNEGGKTYKCTTATGDDGRTKMVCWVVSATG
jgi:hypothetical protein